MIKAVGMTVEREASSWRIQQTRTANARQTSVISKIFTENATGKSRARKLSNPD